ncbi:MAG: hypothetical protein E5X68_18265 [Mesorhizobium sp.]|nr:MAG: hypothetical protein EOQ69_04140 [Mesorhizobium sp.]RWH73401.1 MAG: hypothetical protein EOQ84_07205 [Mesorhizobium sp.]RWL25620.1 MAG: hypothetical protein EOR58_19425 [Mesorhizobium sp.]RWL36467.1 MAG: hypothetical protein EOR63_00480 [Mesorhizobium sp.]RWL40773.1 MAG: hypothetical protein EOR59_04805 [Mesorhizobium sp.]
MGCLPAHGRIDCTLCYRGEDVLFDRSRREGQDWRITANPLSWGNANARIIILGFSKGPTQAESFARTPHDQIAYKGSRPNVGRILAHVGLIKEGSRESQAAAVDSMIADRNGLFHFGSLIRCSVERYDRGERRWKGSGGGMLNRFVATPFGSEVARNCASRFLVNLPRATKLVVMFGMGSHQSYVREARTLLSTVRGKTMREINAVAYEDDLITVVHVEHFASQGDLIPQWLGEGKYRDHPRSKFGKLARASVNRAIDRFA